MAQVASSFGSSKNILIAPSINLANAAFSAVTALGPSGSSAVGTISASLASCRISSVNLFINVTGLQSAQSSIWPFTVYFFSAAPTINGTAAWAWLYAWNSSYLGSISLIGTSNAQTGATGSVYSSILGFGSGTQPGIGGQPLDVVFSPGTTLNNLYFVVVTNYATAALGASAAMILSLNVSTL
jgi:hypothetical protein